MGGRVHAAIIGMNMKLKLQSAMEYLMTYGWAILVIAVVLGVLYSLGIFSPSNFAPKATPGSCQVFRPNGPGTSYDVNLEGTCSGELPEYVASFDANPDEVIDTDTVLISNTVSGYTFSLWIYVPKNAKFPTSNEIAVIGEGGTSGTGVTGIGMNAAGPVIYLGYECSGNDGGVAFEQDSWISVIGTYETGVGGTTFIDGVNSTHGSFGFGPNQVFAIGNGGIGCNANPNPFDGYISNVQVYNATFTTSEAQALYSEGIGGAPVSLQNLVAWYPLNGNANDYSGNNNNGVPSNVIFTGTWQSGYTAP